VKGLRLLDKGRRPNSSRCINSAIVRESGGSNTAVSFENFFLAFFIDKRIPIGSWGTQDGGVKTILGRGASRMEC